MTMTRIARIAFCGLALLTGAATAPAFSLPSSGGIIALNSLPNPSLILATARVTDAKGVTVGAVQKVVLDANGKPQTVEVALLGSNAVVAVSAAQFNYDQAQNVLVAQLDARQIAAAPLAPQG